MQPDFHIEPRAGAPAILITVDAVAARRSVNGWVGGHVADMSPIPFHVP